jgi:hypothetical protein
MLGSRSLCAGICVREQVRVQVRVRVCMCVSAPQEEVVQRHRPSCRRLAQPAGEDAGAAAGCGGVSGGSRGAVVLGVVRLGYSEGAAAGRGPAGSEGVDDAERVELAEVVDAHGGVEDEDGGDEGENVGGAGKRGVGDAQDVGNGQSSGLRRVVSRARFLPAFCGGECLEE